VTLHNPRCVRARRGEVKASRAAFALLFAALLASPSSAEDWPRWRGVRGDGTWNAPALPEKWPAGGLKTVWKQSVGGGYAGVTVADGRVYTMDRVEPVAKPKDGEPDGTERVLCFDAATGKRLWSHTYPVRYGTLGGYANGPRTSPAIHDGKVYTLGAVGHLFCFDAKTGEVLWQHDTVAKFGARVPEWGFAGSPVVEGDSLIVDLGAKDGCLVALDRHTGKEVWRSLADPAGYCTPVVIEPKSGKQVVIWTPENVHGVAYTTGKPLWTVPYKVTYGVSIAPPVFHDGIVFVTGYWEGAKAIELGPQPTDARVIWTEPKALRGLMAQPLYRDKHLYTIDRGLGLTCVELSTGKKLWDDENQLTPAARNPHASIVWLNGSDRVLALNAVGELVLAKLSPRGYEEQSRTKVLAGRVWGHPAFTGHFLFAKTDGAEAWQKGGPHELVCVELAPEK
jgi:outer membrane protein assembly factor BamB